VGKVPPADSSQVDYPFQRMFSLVQLLLKPFFLVTASRTLQPIIQTADA
jgi:hypothetical protein